MIIIFVVAVIWFGLSIAMVIDPFDPHDRILGGFQVFTAGLVMLLTVAGFWFAMNKDQQQLLDSCLQRGGDGIVNVGGSNVCLTTEGKIIF
jgi:hypothetical protein